MKRISVLTVACLLLVSASAAAQNPVGDAYGGAGSVPSGVATTGGGSTAPGVVVAPPVVAPPTQGSGDVVDDTGAGTGPAETTGSPADAVATAAGAQDLRGDSLPFTGFDLLLMLTGAGVLLAAGMGMRRLSRRPL